MLSFISWLQYFAAVLIIGFAYYSIVLVKYYREELLAFVQPRNTSSEPVVANFTGNFIGGIKEDPGESSISSEELQFPDAGSEFQSEIRHEVRALINAFKGLEQKDEFLSLLNLILSRYADAEIDRPQLTQQVIEDSTALSFTIDQADIDDAWSKSI